MQQDKPVTVRAMLNNDIMSIYQRMHSYHFPYFMLGLFLPAFCFVTSSFRGYSESSSISSEFAVEKNMDLSMRADDALVRGFVTPAPSARLRCYWWLNGHVTRESIDHDLIEMKANGYGGVLLVDANGANAEGSDPVPAGPTFGSPEWIALFQHAFETAHRLGLEMTLTITSGWNLSDPFIQPKDAVKILTGRTKNQRAKAETIEEKILTR